MEPAQFLNNAVLKILNAKHDEPPDEKRLALKLKIPPYQRKKLSNCLKQLELEGKISRIKGDRWILAKEAGLVTGVIQFNQKGFAFVLPEDGSEDIYVATEDTGVAMHQDLVVVRPSGNRHGEKKQGRVIRILKRRHEKIVGTFRQSGLFHFVIPDDPRFIHNIYVPKPGTRTPDGIESVKAQLDDKVVVKLLEWHSRHENPQGIIAERLGKSGDPGVDILSIIRKYDLSTEFPTEVLAEVAKFNRAGEPRRDKGRIDLRNDFVITIDPDTAKDFDDAISLQRVGKNYDVGIHIADVSHYVKPGTALDNEAAHRGNSTYLVNQVLPMLPEELSNNLCSLVPHQDRLTFSAFVLLSPKGKVLKTKIAKTIIRSRHRLTYKQAFERLSRKPVDEIDKFLHEAWKIASVLRKNRFQDGALEFDFPEVKVHLNEKGVPIRLEKIENDISHQLIEEFMLLANEVVATELKNRNIPAVYRVHPAPEQSKLEEFRLALESRGIKTGNLTRRKDLQKVLDLINSAPELAGLKVHFLKSLKRATYDPRPHGHFGLAKNNYTHFTSPIRRYSDLIVHRACEVMIKNAAKPDFSKLKLIAAHISQTERNSSDAEHDSVKLKILEYFSLQLDAKRPQKFPARITDIQNYGFFVELPDFAVSGLVHLSAMQDDFYIYNPNNVTIVGRKTRRIYRVGDELHVMVSRIDLFKRQIDFKPAS